MPIVDTILPGEDGFLDYVRKFGRVAGAGVAQSMVWDGTTPYEGWLATEEYVSIVSDDPEDNPSGTGTGYIQWTGQGNNGIEKTYSLTLNGVTPVLSSTLDAGVKFNIIYTSTTLKLNSVLSQPIAGANKGTITITSVTTGKVMAIVKPTLGRTQMMIWRCPSDRSAKFEKISIYPESGVNKPLLAQLWARNSMSQSWFCVGQIDVANQIASITHPFPDYISPGTDICLTVTPTQADTNVSAQMWIEKVALNV